MGRDDKGGIKEVSDLYFENWRPLFLFIHGGYFGKGTYVS